ncbi:hypothetical protein MBLNU230_g3591t1 [Neophaeotheca triangularis]
MTREAAVSEWDALIIDLENFASRSNSGTNRTISAGTVAPAAVRVERKNASTQTVALSADAGARESGDEGAVGRLEEKVSKLEGSLAAMDGRIEARLGRSEGAISELQAALDKSTAAVGQVNEAVSDVRELLGGSTNANTQGEATEPATPTSSSPNKDVTATAIAAADSDSLRKHSLLGMPAEIKLMIFRFAYQPQRVVRLICRGENAMNTAGLIGLDMYQDGETDIPVADSSPIPPSIFVPLLVSHEFMQAALEPWMEARILSVSVFWFRSLADYYKRPPSLENRCFHSLRALELRCGLPLSRSDMAQLLSFKCLSQLHLSLGNGAFVCGVLKEALNGVSEGGDLATKGIVRLLARLRGLRSLEVSLNVSTDVSGSKEHLAQQTGAQKLQAFLQPIVTLPRSTAQMPKYGMGEEVVSKPLDAKEVRELREQGLRRLVSSRSTGQESGGTQEGTSSHQ